MADAFTRAKLRRLDGAMRDSRLTASTRVVFYEIVQHINRVSGNAWPSELRLAQRLGLGLATVKRAVIQLREFGYIEFEKTGRHNTYRLAFSEAGKGIILSPVEGAQGAHTGRAPPAATGIILSQNRDHSGTPNRAQNEPLSSLRDTLKENFSKRAHHEPSLLGCAREGLSRKADDPIASKADDGKIQVLLSEQLGWEAVHALNEIDGGRPLKQLTVLRRDRPLTAIEIGHARNVIAGDLQSRRRAIACDERAEARAKAIRADVDRYRKQGGGA
ncbi:MAG: helix-turn-helix domain-containing protein [Proteobacteria bacterium]|nr:helix-turn-helix domain-containing protein [Pseudomonadota bacterium]